MRKVLGVLAALVVSGSLVAASLADEKADVARVEQELRAADEAVAIHKRARERAEKAVRQSSLGVQCRAAKAKYDKMMNGERVEGIPSRITENVRVCERKHVVFIKKMTRIFLTDEIKQAQQKKLDGLMRELQKIRKRDYTEA